MSEAMDAAVKERLGDTHNEEEYDEKVVLERAMGIMDTPSEEWNLSSLSLLCSRCRVPFSLFLLLVVRALRKKYSLSLSCLSDFVRALLMNLSLLLVCWEICLTSEKLSACQWEKYSASTLLGVRDAGRVAPYPSSSPNQFCFKTYLLGFSLLDFTISPLWAYRTES
jgi:hypothetical protein